MLSAGAAIAMPALVSSAMAQGPAPAGGAGGQTSAPKIEDRQLSAPPKAPDEEAPGSGPQAGAPDAPALAPSPTDGPTFEVKSIRLMGLPRSADLKQADEAEGKADQVVGPAFPGTVRPGQGLTSQDVLGLRVPLVKTDAGYSGRPAGAAAGSVATELVRLGDLPELSAAGARFYGSALQEFSTGIRELYNQRGYAAIIVASPTTTGPNAGQDSDFKALKDRGELVLRIEQGLVSDVRTVVRDEEGENVEDPLAAERYRGLSPIGPGDLVKRTELDAHLARLNRSPVRRVDAALAQGSEEWAVSLDYLVTQAKPWLLYSQLSNTGTEETTILRERFGLAHYDLSGVDDVLTVDYVTGDFEEVHAVSASYERPLFGLLGPKGRLYGSWVKYDASEVGLGGFNFSGETSAIGGELSQTVFQSGELFLDAVFGARFEHQKVEQPDLKTSNDFVLPYAGVRVSRRQNESDIFGSAIVEGNWADLAGTREDDIDELGRLNTSENWVVLRAEVGTSFYLEPLLDPKFGEEGSTLAHEVYLVGRGTMTSSDRLPPSFTEVAGGLYTVRGYPEAFVFGDRLVGATAEYRWHIPRMFSPAAQPGSLLGKSFRWRPTRLFERPDWDLVLRGFCDFATTQIVDREEFEDNEVLLSAGIGAEISIRRNFSARVDWGIALQDVTDGNDSVEAGNSRVHFVLTVVF